MSGINMEFLTTPRMATCAYCDGFFVPNDEAAIPAMREHIEKCPDHPMSKLRRERNEFRMVLVDLVGTDDLQKLYILSSRGFNNQSKAAIKALIETHPTHEDTAREDTAKKANVRRYRPIDSCSWAELKSPEEERETLRDKFAARALEGDWSCQDEDTIGMFNEDTPDSSLLRSARVYYRMADAMMIARKEKEST